MLAGVGALLSAGVSHGTINAPEPRDRVWSFRVFLDDDPIGYHRFVLRTQGDTRELESTARFRVRLLFINAYHYDHEAHEIWRGDCLTRLDSTSKDDGRPHSVHARADDGVLTIDAPPRHYSVDGCAMSFAYWNPAMLQQSHLINPETGEDVAVSIRPAGEEEISVRGSLVPARRYHLHATGMDIDLWYSPDGEWLALESPSQGGHRLHYALE